MLSVGIIDDGVGIFSTYYKLRQALNANYICQILNDSFPLSKLPFSKLYDVGLKAVSTLSDMGCDIVVLSSAALSSICYKKLSLRSPVPLYSCEAPVLHAATYTASCVLVCGDSLSCMCRTVPNSLCCAMERFQIIAEQENEREIVSYIEQSLKDYIGKFDCIALASSSMNMYKHCFLRVCPNVRVFDSLDGVARRIRKKYKKTAQDEGILQVLDEQGRDIKEKYDIFFE